MKYKAIRKGLMVMAVTLIALGLFGCADPLGIKGDNGKGIFARDNKSGVCGFSYSYDGTIGGGNYFYQVNTVNGEAVMSYHSMQYDELEDLSMKIDPEVLNKINELYLKYHAEKWNGYSKYASNVSDGSGFSMGIRFNDGASWRVHGMNCSPDGYRDFEKEILPLFYGYIEQLNEKARETRIENGVKGKLTSFMATFKQRGDSGSDSYEIMVMLQKYREKNVDIRITSDSGEFIEEGKYNYYFSLEDQQICFEQIADLIRKYDVVKWMDWDRTSEDYNNSEWFQISFGFEEGSINACGTLHPENYELFKKEFLQTVVAMLRQTLAAHPEIENRE